MKGNEILGIEYDSKNNLVMLLKLDICSCGTHMHKLLIRGDTKENILKAIDIILTKEIEKNARKNY